MLKLKKLKITNDEPLCICFLGKIKKKIEMENEETYIFANREEDIYIESPIEEMSFKVKDKEKIKNILFYFFENCDEGESPQSLWETSNGLEYKSLLKDYSNENKKEFDNTCDYLLNILDEELKTERIFISDIEVAYPDNWIVTYENSK